MADCTVQMSSRPDPQCTRSWRQSKLSTTLFRSSAAKATRIGKVVKPRGPMTTPTEQVRTDVLLAIKPIHLSNIVSGKKNHEYRKYRLHDGVERLWFYETRGEQGMNGASAITHIATIPISVRRQPGEVPEEPFGIGNSEFNAGEKQSKYGYPILEVFELVQPVPLEEMKQVWGMKGAPMGWSYVKQPMWQDRWGEAEERETRVRKVF